MRFIAAAIQAKCSTNFCAMSDVDRVVHGEFDGDVEHVLAVQRHPGGAVGLLEVAAGRQRRAAVEDADVVQAEEAALEDVVAVESLRLSHQVKFFVSFWKALSSQARSPRPVRCFSSS